MSAHCPLVSVLMSCYNASKWLPESVKSILNQTFVDFEFLIVDDGSVDSTPFLLREYQSQDKRIRVISKPNTGLADSLNRGLDEARGRWIARMDADDISEPRRLESQVEVASSATAPVFIGSGHTAIGESGELRDVYSYPPDHRSLVRNLKTLRRFPAHSSAMYRKVAVQSIGSYRTRLKRAQDMDLWLRLSETGQFVCLQHPLVRIRSHPEQVSHEEGGNRQIMDCRLALTSYWITKFGGVDPIGADEARFQMFKVWLRAELDNAAIFELQADKSRLKTEWARKPGFPRRIFRYVFSLPHAYGLAYALVMDQLFGERLTRRLALNWLKSA